MTYFVVYGLVTFWGVIELLTVKKFNAYVISVVLILTGALGLMLSCAIEMTSYIRSL